MTIEEKRDYTTKWIQSYTELADLIPKMITIVSNFVGQRYSRVFLNALADLSVERYGSLRGFVDVHNCQWGFEIVYFPKTELGKYIRVLSSDKLEYISENLIEQLKIQYDYVLSKIADLQKTNDELEDLCRRIADLNSELSIISNSIPIEINTAIMFGIK